MKTVLSLLCWLCVVVMLTGCDNGDDGGSSSARGDFPQVSFLINESTGQVTCYNADSNVITTQQICTWNCAYYEGRAPSKVTLYFDEGLVCEKSADSSIDASVDKTTDIDETGTETTTYSDSSSGSTSGSTDCTEEITLDREHFSACAI